MVQIESVVDYAKAQVERYWERSEAMLVHEDAPIGRDAALKAVVWLKRNFGREIEEAVSTRYAASHARRRHISG